MTRHLLDVKLLIALIEPAQLQHDAVHEEFGGTGKRSFATCPIGENALLRIVGHSRYPSPPGRANCVADALAALRAFPGHVFWPDGISPVGRPRALALRQQMHDHPRR